MGNKEETLESVLARISERAKRRMDLNYLVTRWSQFVREVERGYKLSIYDYTNDLSVRDLLGEVISSLSITGARVVEDSIASSDEDYRHATRVSTRPLLPLPPGVHSWWWFRIPTQMSNELRQDLVAEGFLAGPGSEDKRQRG